MYAHFMNTFILNWEIEEWRGCFYMEIHIQAWPGTALMFLTYFWKEQPEPGNSKISTSHSFQPYNFDIVLL